MKLQSNRTLYYDYHSCYVTDESPKQMFDSELRVGEDYEFARTGTIFEVDEDEGYFMAICKRFNINFKDYDDMVQSGWFDVVEGGAKNG